MSSPVDPACTNSLSQRARGRSFTGITNLSPDHTSLIAHTLTSTSPAARPRARTLFSSRSLTTPELFLGHATHNMPAGSSLLLHGGKLFFRSAWVLTKSKTKSGGSCSAISHRAIASFSSAFGVSCQLRHHVTLKDDDSVSFILIIPGTDANLNC